MPGVQQAAAAISAAVREGRISSNRADFYAAQLAAGQDISHVAVLGVPRPDGPLAASAWPGEPLTDDMAALWPPTTPEEHELRVQRAQAARPVTDDDVNRALWPA